MPGPRKLDPQKSPSHWWGAEFRRAREEAQMTQGAFAATVPCDVSLVSRVEGGELAPNDAFVAAIAREFREQEWLARFWVASTGWSKAAGVAEAFIPYWQAEAEATILRCWGCILVPGLLQTENYMRCVLSVERYTPERLADLIKTRLDRQAVIGRAHLRAIVDYQVLRRLIGSPAVMAEQCAHLATLAERPDIAFHVLPEGVNMGTWGAISLATSWSGTTTVCMNAFEDVPGTAPEKVSKMMLAFDQILGAAMGCAESLAFARDMEETWKAQMLAGASPATAAATAVTAWR